jgi:hypothetical protein
MYNLALYTHTSDMSAILIDVVLGHTHIIESSAKGKE